VLFPESFLGVSCVESPVCFVSSPALLKRFEAVSPLDADFRLAAVFSSGGVLDREVALRSGGLFGQSVLEVFGSTEFGGVGWRCQSEVDDSGLWSPLPGVCFGGSVAFCWG